jgi:two-component system nitrate/nitrite response regulator NarL
MTNTYAINPSTTEMNFAPVVTASTVDAPRSVSICDTQPVTAEGVRNLLSGAADLRFLGTVDSLQQAAQLVQKGDPDVLILDKAFGIQAVLDWLAEQHPAPGAATPITTRKTSFIIWGVSVSEAEAVRFLQAGARGILRKTAGVQSVLACLRTVAEGRSWTEDSLFGDAPRAAGYPRSELTGRERQVLELVEQGFKNKDIGNELGIRPGTVKIHLKHIFQKTGVRGRYGLAFNSMKDRLTAAA